MYQIGENLQESLGLQRRDIQGTMAHGCALQHPTCAYCLGDGPCGCCPPPSCAGTGAVLRHMRDAELDDAVGRRGEVDAFHLDAAAHRAVQSGDDAHQDGLAGAVGADHGDRLAGDLASLQADRAPRSARTCPTTCRTGSECGQPQRTTTTASDWCGPGSAILYEAEAATDPRQPNATVRRTM